ncbi:MAG: trehalose-6-phosphate synthase [Micromonosporaceae bacterium]
MTPPTRPKQYDLVMAVNWLPVIRDHKNGGVRWRDRASGAYAALRGVASARRGAWVGWSGLADTALDPFPVGDLWLHPVPLSEREADEHYRGYCASGLAPLYHGSVEPPVFKEPWHEAYQAVNDRFAATVADIAAPGGVVWLHDFHLQLAPAHLRRLRPDLLVGFFMHSPFPPAELFLRLPMRSEIMSGLLGADLIGFQHARSANNFLELAGHLGLPTGDDFVDLGDHQVKVGVFPMSINATEVRNLANDPTVRTRAAALRRRLKDPRTVFLAVSRLDPAEGIEQRLSAYAELLAEGRLDPAETVLIQVAEPDGDGGFHEALRHRVDRKVAEINGLYSRVGHAVVHYVHRELDRAERVALYLAADVMLATPLRAGMTLSAKEFVAARADDSGHLVLSEFTGAAADLPEAIIVNPYDREGLKDAMLTAVAEEHGAKAMQTMRERLQGEDAERWAGTFLAVLGSCAAQQTLTTAAHPGR